MVVTRLWNRLLRATLKSASLHGPYGSDISSLFCLNFPLFHKKSPKTSISDILDTLPPPECDVRTILKARSLVCTSLFDKSILVILDPIKICLTVILEVTHDPINDWSELCSSQGNGDEDAPSGARGRSKEKYVYNLPELMIYPNLPSCGAFFQSCSFPAACGGGGTLSSCGFPAIRDRTKLFRGN